MACRTRKSWWTNTSSVFTGSTISTLWEAFHSFDVIYVWTFQWRSWLRTCITLWGQTITYKKQLWSYICYHLMIAWISFSVPPGYRSRRLNGRVFEWDQKNPTKNKNTKAHTQTQTSKQQTPKLLNGRKLIASNCDIHTGTNSHEQKVCNHQSHSRSSLKKMGLPQTYQY